MPKDILGGREEYQFRVSEWFLAFKTSLAPSAARWMHWVTAGQRFKHVMCFGYIPAVGCWVFCDWSESHTGLWVAPDDEADALLAQAQAGAVVVRFVAPLYVFESRLKPGFWCVPAVAHLTGLKSCALRADGLYRDCLAQGGEIVCGNTLHEAQDAGERPGTGAAGEVCAA